MAALLVNEIFWSLQGEGAFTGTPSVFFRLQGCSVGCPWCDTGYAQKCDPRDRLPDQSPVVLEKKAADPRYTLAGEDWLLNVLEKGKTPGIHVVLTGGEPCRQPIAGFAAALLERGSGVQVETSGTEPVVVPDGVWVTLSPKAAPVVEPCWKRADEVKLPVASQEDLDRWSERLASLPASKVWLQPVSQGREATKLCIDTCMRHNWRLSVQMHKYHDLR